MSGCAVCFDLHQTILTSTLELRPGIIDLLKKSKEGGTVNILTTTGGGRHLQDVFKRTGIKPYFDYVFEGDQINVGAGKRYEPAAEILGFSPSDAPHKMLVTGDLESDQPADLPLVFVHHPGGYKYHASLLYKILDRLWTSGNGSFVEGFNKFERDQETPVRMFGSDDVGLGTMLDDVLITLSLRDPKAAGTNLPLFKPGIVIPTLRIISADTYLLPPSGQASIESLGN